MGNEAVNRFLEMMSAERGASANTLEAYGRDVEEFLTYCGGMALKEISRDDVGDFVQYLGREGRSPKTVARKLSAVREFFKFLYTEKDIKDNPAADVLTPKQEKPLPKFLSEDEIKRLIAAAKECSGPKGRQMTAMLELMYASGLRVSELVSLPENCINFDRRQVFVRGKGSKERVVPPEPPEQPFPYCLYRKTALILTGDRFSYAAKAVRKGLFRWLRRPFRPFLTILNSGIVLFVKGGVPSGCFPPKVPAADISAEILFLSALKNWLSKPVFILPG